MIFSFGSAPREGKRGNDEGGGKGERERPLYSASLRGRRKKEREKGEGESAKAGKREVSGKGPLPSLPNPPPFFPFLLSPTPFDACYSG